jgi:hypothetical protein
MLTIVPFLLVAAASDPNHDEVLAADPPGDAAPVDEAPAAQIEDDPTRLPSYVANQSERQGLEVHPHEPNEASLGIAKIEVGTWARVGYHALHNGGATEHGPYLGIARLQVRVSDARRVSGFVQLGADRGQLALLDAKMRAHFGGRFILAVGRMKVPVSHDFLIPAPQMVLPTRGFVTQPAPGRANGVQLRYRVEGEHVVATARVGVFDPMRPGSFVLAGPQLAAQGSLHTHAGFFVHGAVAAWTPGKHTAIDVLVHGPAWDRHADLAVGWSNEAWTLHLEGIAARPVGGGEVGLGGTAVVAHRVPVASERVVLEPVVAADVLTAGEPLGRGTLALNVHQDGWHLFQTLAWEAVATPHGVSEHRVLIQVQAGL